MNGIRVALYARVSTADQHCEMQLRDLREYAKNRRWETYGEYVDTGWSGAKASRPELDRLMKDASLHRFDVIIVWKLDRFGRSVLNLSQQLQTLESYGVRFIAITQGLDTDQANPTSRLILHILGAVAEFEREMIKERVNAGLKQYKRAYASGHIGKQRHSKSGKNLAVGRPQKVFRRDRAAELRAQGMSWRKIADQLGVPQATIRLALKDA